MFAALTRPRPGPIARFFARRRMRRELAHMASLEDRLLSDVGLTRETAREIQLPKWDAPAHWRV
ncbi:hypothetical protein [Solirhodobacter olei]|uniref:hypothetical protein n=1 Tax=Solirhodobacter olei TaxID=2493082 RepID=UPI001F4DC12B|nr:hypothetical protein [Solirhodobacter olei]